MAICCYLFSITALFFPSQTIEIAQTVHRDVVHPISEKSGAGFQKPLKNSLATHGIKKNLCPKDECSASIFWYVAVQNAKNLTNGILWKRSF